MMMATLVTDQAPVLSPAYHRAQVRGMDALHINALTLLTTLHLLALCQLAVRLAHRQCSPPLPSGPGSAPRHYSEESLLLIMLLRNLWRLLYQDMHDWLAAWPALALACGLPLDRHDQPHIPSSSQQWKCAHAAGAPVPKSLFVLLVRTVIHRCLINVRDLIIDSAPILTWRRADPDAVVGHAPAHHLRPLCRGSGLLVCFLVSPANVHDAPFARPLLEWAVRLYHVRPRKIRLDAGYWGLKLIAWFHCVLGEVAVIPWNPKRQKSRCCLPPPGLLMNWASAPALNASPDGPYFFSPATPVPLWLVGHRFTGHFGCQACWTP
jgi:Transposase DDE domain